MNSYINPLAFRDWYAEDYYKVDSVAEQVAGVGGAR